MIVDANVLIDAVVRQTTVLLAQLATATGGRATLANTANQVFVNLVHELKAQGIGNKVIADMFGLALRTYHEKVQRLSESTTVRGKSLWAATLEYLQERKSATQTEVLSRFRNDDETTLRSVMADLVDSGLVFRSGRGANATYMAREPDELVGGDGGGASVEALAWVAVSRFGPATVDALIGAVPLDRDELESALAKLVSDGRVVRSEQGEIVTYRTDLCWIPLGMSVGWEGAVFDHYQAVVTTICAKLGTGMNAARASDQSGGSTFALTVWDGHPEQQAVLGLLAQMRSQVIALRERVSEFNRQHEPPRGALRVIAYVGQTVMEADDSGEEK